MPSTTKPKRKKHKRPVDRKTRARRHIVDWKGTLCATGTDRLTPVPFESCRLRGSVIIKFENGEEAPYLGDNGCGRCESIARSLFSKGLRR